MVRRTDIRSNKTFKVVGFAPYYPGGANVLLQTGTSSRYSNPNTLKVDTFQKVQNLCSEGLLLLRKRVISGLLKAHLFLDIHRRNLGESYPSHHLG